MKRKAFIPLVLGLFIGLLTVKLVVDAVRKAQGANRASQVVKAVRAKQDINAFESVSAEMVEVVETNDSLFAPANERIESVDGVVDRVTSKAIPSNAAVLKSMLAPEGTRPGMVGRIPPGFRAVSVKIDEVTGVSYQLKPGDWVDVIVVMDVTSAARGQKDTVAEVILQHLQVAAIGYGSDAPTSGSGTQSKVKPAKSATLLVPEEDVPKLHLAATRGKITLAMRGEDDKRLEDMPFAHTGDLLSGANAKQGTPPAPAVEPPKPPRWLTGGGDEQQPPHSVMVFHQSAKDRSVKSIERVTFEHGKSSKIVDIGVGPPTRTMSTMAGVKQTRASSLPSPSATGGESEATQSESQTPKTTEPADEAGDESSDDDGQ